MKPEISEAAVTCGRCQSKADVVRVQHIPGLTIRTLECGECDESWQTAEQDIPNSRRKLGKRRAVEHGDSIHHVATGSTPVAGDLFSGSYSLSGSGSSLQSVGDPPERARSTGRARFEYSAEFEKCWQAYGRRQEKAKAYAEWVRATRTMKSEQELSQSVLRALKWQGPGWAEDGWTYAPYFERYLKRRKWEDEPVAAPKLKALQGGKGFVAEYDTPLSEGPIRGR